MLCSFKNDLYLKWYNYRFSFFRLWTRAEHWQKDHNRRLLSPTDIVIGGCFRRWQYETNSTGGGCGNYSSTLYTDENNITNMLYCNQEIRHKPQLIFLFIINKLKKRLFHLHLLWKCLSLLKREGWISSPRPFSSPVLTPLHFLYDSMFLFIIFKSSQIGEIAHIISTERRDLQLKYEGRTVRLALWGEIAKSPNISVGEVFNILCIRPAMILQVSGVIIAPSLL